MGGVRELTHLKSKFATYILITVSMDTVLNFAVLDISDITNHERMCVFFFNDRMKPKAYVHLYLYVTVKHNDFGNVMGIQLASVTIQKLSLKDIFIRPLR
jgi:hypothetical protein